MRAAARMKDQDDPKISIGARLRQLRQDGDLTLATIAQRSGISASTLSKIENNKVSPTFANLLKLSEAFGVSLSRMIGDTESSPPPTTARIAVTRADEVAFTTTQTYDMGPLCTDLRNKRMSPFLDNVRSSAAGPGEKLVRHMGEEFVYVLKGELEIHTEHYEPIRLSPGDSAYFDSQMAHAFRSAGEEQAQMLMVWLPPEGTDAENGQRLIRQITQQDVSGDIDHQAPLPPGSAKD
ncbi:helix-turn-helix domain-containing protein [Histidinibacterium lentulum]|uniref:Helix-turn-helix domain-containing protein n=2 Tax=Histidinibacterium lentulum TaxID=2480588 RepID=A0A3N2R8K9_9RHOB|nr:helix-turn-helix domain-containing protein [Histidinibacterium lentulum]